MTYLSDFDDEELVDVVIGFAVSLTENVMKGTTGDEYEVLEGQLDHARDELLNRLALRR